MTAWLMVALSTLGWGVIDWNRYRNPHLHNPRATFVFFLPQPALMMAKRIRKVSERRIGMMYLC